MASPQEDAIARDEGGADLCVRDVWLVLLQFVINVLPQSQPVLCSDGAYWNTAL